MPAVLRGITLLLQDPAKTTPLKQAKIVGMSFTVDLRSLDVSILRYDVATGEMVPLADFPISLRLLNSNQTDTLLTNAQGYTNAPFPDENIEVQLSPAAVPAGHQAQLRYAIKTQKKNMLTVVFIPDTLRRYYPVRQFV